MGPFTSGPWININDDLVREQLNEFYRRKAGMPPRTKASPELVKEQQQSFVSLCGEEIFLHIKDKHQKSLTNRQVAVRVSTAYFQRGSSWSQRL